MGSERNEELSIKLSTRNWLNGGVDRARLDTRNYETNSEVVGVPGIEPGTSTLSVLRSNQLSYTPLNNSFFKILFLKILTVTF